MSFFWPLVSPGWIHRLYGPSYLGVTRSDKGSHPTGDTGILSMNMLTIDELPCNNCSAIVSLTLLIRRLDQITSQIKRSPFRRSSSSPARVAERIVVLLPTLIQQVSSRCNGVSFVMGYHPVSLDLQAALVSSQHQLGLLSCNSSSSDTTIGSCNETLAATVPRTHFALPWRLTAA